MRESLFAIHRLHHQSTTAPGCTTQLRDVRGLPIPTRQANQFLTTFLINCLFFFVPVLIRNEIPESIAEHPSLLIPISFFIKILSSLVIILKNVYELST